MSAMLFALSLAASRPTSLASAIGGIGTVLFGCAVPVFVWLIASPLRPSGAPSITVREGASMSVREPYGPYFPTGRYFEMVAWRDECARSPAERTFDLTVLVEGVHGILQLAEKIYQAMDEAGKDFKVSRECLRSGDALGEAGAFLLLRDVQTALAKLYTQGTGQPAEDLEVFRLPEENIARRCL